MCHNFSHSNIFEMVICLIILYEFMPQNTICRGTGVVSKNPQLHSLTGQIRELLTQIESNLRRKSESCGGCRGMQMSVQEKTSTALHCISTCCKAGCSFGRESVLVLDVPRGFQRFLS